MHYIQYYGRGNTHMKTTKTRIALALALLLCILPFAPIGGRTALADEL